LSAGQTSINRGTRYLDSRAPSFRLVTVPPRSEVLCTGGRYRPTRAATLSLSGIGQEQTPLAPFRLLTILPPHSALTSTSLLAVTIRLHHTPSMSVLGIYTVVAFSSARAHLQLEVPATEAGLSSSPAASSSLWSSPSIAIPRRPPAPQRSQEGLQEHPIPPRLLIHRR
jgi:hypothetical protein